MELSIIVPVYNVADFLPSCLESLAAQPLKDMEVWLMDDASTDGSQAVCAEFCRRDTRFHLVALSHGGVSAARNAGLQRATGRWVTFVDGDDWVEPGAFQTLMAAISAETDVVCGGYLEHLPQPGAVPIPHVAAAGASYAGAEAVREVLRRDGSFCAVWGKLYRRESLLTEGVPLPFDCDLACGEDEVWLTRLLPGRCLQVIPLAVYHWRSRADSASRREQLTPALMTMLTAKQRTLALVSGDAGLTALALSRLVNDCFLLLIFARLEGKRAIEQRLWQAMSPCWVGFRRSGDVPRLRRWKVYTIVLALKLHLPKGLIRRLANAGRRQRR